METIQYTAGHFEHSLVTSFTHGAARAWLDTEPAVETQSAPIAHEPLRLRILRTAEERMEIAELRKLAALGVEQDLRLGLASMEQSRDDMGLVAVICSGARILATLRFVPAGHGLTGAERLFEKERFDSEILAGGSWEIGRLIMAPADRNPEILLRCMRAAFHELLKMQNVRRFHATTTLAMARLWRRFGMRTVFTRVGDSGTRYALVYGSVGDVANAMGVALAH
jgi:hypothetical protein